MFGKEVLKEVVLVLWLVLPGTGPSENSIEEQRYGRRVQFVPMAGLSPLTVSVCARLENGIEWPFWALLIHLALNGDEILVAEKFSVGTSHPEYSRCRTSATPAVAARRQGPHATDPHSSESVRAKPECAPACDLIHA